MKKQIGYLLVATSLVYGCTTMTKLDRQIASFALLDSEEHDSNKGLTTFIDAGEGGGGSDPMIINKKGGGTYDCNTIRKVNYSLNGKTYTKLAIEDDIQLRCPNVRAFKTNMTWKVKKDSWSEQDEAGFSAFVKQLGYGQCKNLDRCLSTPKANSLISEEDMYNLYYSDCADLPYYLRAYYAYKKQLPFSFVSGIEPVPFTPAQLEIRAKKRAGILASEGEEAAAKFDVIDTRYSQNGNLPRVTQNMPNTSGVIRDFANWKLVINDSVSTGTYRMLNGDYYSPEINSKMIKPGTAVYGTKGHAAIVYDVKPNGQILVMDAHPGNSITHNGWIKEEFILDAVKHAGMFKNFRPIKVVNGVKDAEGNLIKGLIVKASDEEIPGFSLEQYDANNFKSGSKTISLEEWVGLRLAGGNYRINPIDQITDQTNQLCSSFVDRIPVVQNAVDSGMTKTSIAAYPRNIFGAEGDWETHSSPSSDLRRRADTLSILASAKDVVARLAKRDPVIEYKGVNIKADLANAFKAAAAACKITYKNSVGTSITLSLLDLSKRVGLFSFDPYMCPELRWGATGTELATCNSSAEKKEIYKLTQFLRNNNVKDPDAVHGYTLQQLRSLNTANPASNSPTKYNYDIAAQLLAL